MAGYKNLAHKQASKIPLKVATVVHDWKEGDQSDSLKQIAKVHGLHVHSIDDGSDSYVHHVANRKMTKAELKEYSGDHDD